MAAVKRPKEWYRGNAAYDLSDRKTPDVGGIRTQASPNGSVSKKPSVRYRAHRKVRVRKQQRVSLLAIGGFLTVAACAVGLLMSYGRLTAVSHRVSELKDEVRDLQAQQEVLQAKYERVFDLNAIEQSFTERGAMAKPRSDQMVYIDMSEPDSARVIQPDSDGQAASDSIKNFFAMAVEYFK